MSDDDEGFKIIDNSFENLKKYASEKKVALTLRFLNANRLDRVEDATSANFRRCIQESTSMSQSHCSVHFWGKGCEKDGSGNLYFLRDGGRDIEQVNIREELEAKFGVDRKDWFFILQDLPLKFSRNIYRNPIYKSYQSLENVASALSEIGVPAVCSIPSTPENAFDHIISMFYEHLINGFSIAQTISRLQDYWIKEEYDFGPPILYLNCADYSLVSDSDSGEQPPDDISPSHNRQPILSR
jgi:hypothetical protein